MTERVEMTRVGDHIEVRAWGGYDGYIKRCFATPELALEYVEFLWQH